MSMATGRVTWDSLVRWLIVDGISSVGIKASLVVSLV